MLLRETVEVVLVVAVTFSYLSDNKLAEFLRWAIAGVVLGTILDLIICGILIAVFVTIKNNAFDSASDSEKIFEGTLMLFSSILITVFGRGMAKVFNIMNAKVGRKITVTSKSINAATTGIPATTGTEKTTDVEIAEDGASSVAYIEDQTNVDALLQDT